MRNDSQVLTHPEAATRIVELQSKLDRRVDPDVRNVLTAEQRTLWDSFFTNEPYERIREVSTH